ncbi:MAG: flavodoxin-dependent (E)-4-hydroxy-3-methylbut-2-enyl-diphosphate synthase, partial [Bacteroidota bacterium]
MGIISDHEAWMVNRHRDRHYPLISAAQALTGIERHESLNFLQLTIDDLNSNLLDFIKLNINKIVIVLSTSHSHGLAEQRSVFALLMNAGIQVPVVISRAYTDLQSDDFQLFSATDAGGLLIDGLGDGVFFRTSGCGGDQFINATAFNILQATRTRISKTEYISCPSCGRTLFDLQETTARIRSRTYHLKGVKIGIMGCIVNGPGEMADADYGYVGSGPGRINLYRGKEVVKRNVPTADAVDELIGLIR